MSGKLIKKKAYSNISNYSRGEKTMKRIKTKAEVEEKMTDRVSTAGKFLKDAIDKAEDPIDVILSNPDKYIKKLVDGLIQAQKEGKILAGFKKAKKRDAWKNSKDRAGAHYEERTGDMVKNALEDYDARAKVIDEARKAVDDMPTTTRAQRIAKSAKYQDIVGKGFDSLYGRKGV